MKQAMGRFCLCVLVVVVCGCSTTRDAPVFEGMGDHARRITTSDPVAQRYFDQGLTLAYGFNFWEAARSFRTAARHDPGCAMAQWGIAYALGPTMNGGMSADNGVRAFEAVQRAVALSEGASPVERQLITALAQRYASPPPENRDHLNRAYADAMRQVWKQHPEDTDVAVLFADSMMNVDPWNQWTKEFKANPGTLEIVAAIEGALARDPTHPGANHFYIHVMEASGKPERAEAAADRLGRLTPGIAHMVHMPSHIYVQLGRFRDAMRVNAEASDKDRSYIAAQDPADGYYYSHAHNNHFRVWSAMYQGRYEDALESCRKTVAELPERLHGEEGVGEWLIMDIHVHVRFGKWEALLARKEPRADQPFSVATWHYGRGMAYANTGRIAEARAEARAFDVEAGRVSKKELLFMTPAHQVLEVARAMLAGETAFHAGDFETAFKHLRAAVSAEDALRYSEPSPWMMPTRHALGALLLDRGRIAEARRCYEEDLRKHRGNGWSLHGLAECLEREGHAERAASVRTAFQKSWRFASVEIAASCFCRPAK